MHHTAYLKKTADAPDPLLNTHLCIKSWYKLQFLRQMQPTSMNSINLINTI